MTDAALPTLAPGRSLTRLAFDRLLRNRASVASFCVLVAISASCVFGPYLAPHAYDQVFESYVRTPPSLEPYPREDTLQQAMTDVALHARVDLADFSVEGQSFKATFTSEKEIDPRVVRYVDRAN